jgi:hypothetical protein
MQVVMWGGLCFVQFRVLKPVYLCVFITATPVSTLIYMLLLALAVPHCVMSLLQQLHCVSKL